MSSEGYSGRDAADIVGITYRQLDYWARTDLIRPSLADAKGSGSRRRYSYRDLVELKMIKTLLDSGQKLERVRAAFEYLRDLGDDLSSVQLVIAGEVGGLGDSKVVYLKTTDVAAARELRSTAEEQSRRADERAALAEEEAERARRERAEAEERARRADEVDPEVDIDEDADGR